MWGALSLTRLTALSFPAHTWERRAVPLPEGDAMPIAADFTPDELTTLAADVCPLCGDLTFPSARVVGPRRFYECRWCWHAWVSGPNRQEG